ncbi:hypothetical protein K437DRAFT_253734 [Tilletiaria anomala UBC 951]|uniref:Uncharacterized protein n=1 Tax=Tilletiaria anomala (strain ATCC 24038 / CBS 436.72 / UBC 951) TaxID=1037660 RepID=A0A066WP57_TILAU|nr:uncharacterized protein K437DRAFT_253734 [Tilletiaria anomala UBC 951]KDN52804.1 hypothetical protein K437DRAFT_253734 [Tilletiaria anomala UBC 951]
MLHAAGRRGWHGDWHAWRSSRSLRPFRIVSQRCSVTWLVGPTTPGERWSVEQGRDRDKEGLGTGCSRTAVSPHCCR